MIQQASEQMISYAHYMELALYGEHGYYMNNTEKIGRAGDFYTSSSLGSVYAAIWCDWFYDTCRKRGLPFQIIECGAGTGAFAADVLSHWHAHYDQPLTYVIIEKSPDHRQRMKEKLPSSVAMYESLAEWKGKRRGILFCNELLDALPVHVVNKHNGSLYEVMVTVDEHGRFQEKKQLLQNTTVHDWLMTHEVDVKEGHTLEVPVAMTQELATLYAALDEGVFAFVDYGYRKEEWQEPFVKDGSLRGYDRHQLIHPLQQLPGYCDLTAHVHWDAVMTIGAEHGVKTEQLCSQRDFLVAHGLLDQLQEVTSSDPFAKAAVHNRHVRSLLMDQGLSAYFQVLIQQKQRP
ncbi:hypothetical protein A374_15202 [Fictibacillus macauensis ZFHKF-1]|uniref:SAM-dependent methyltransferase n=1 Tax=Fictibacillus macauensis ZFHKF-1 TaxID=1196324 RepID=I8AGH6_9BACL|nr:SAM-dependent methyltransferase [Fictibacillus macauensis]EIT84484.1 hypothetical protein A374_15202 [Fictibacillus macauensis ZFHKF-1]